MTYLLYVCICYILPACHLAPTSAGFDKEFPRSCVLQLTFRHQASQPSTTYHTTGRGMVDSCLSYICKIYYMQLSQTKRIGRAEEGGDMGHKTRMPDRTNHPTTTKNKQTMRTNPVSPLNSASPPITLFARVCEHKGVKRIDNV